MRWTLWCRPALIGSLQRFPYSRFPRTFHSGPRVGCERDVRRVPGCPESRIIGPPAGAWTATMLAPRKSVASAIDLSTCVSAASSFKASLPGSHARVVTSSAATPLVGVQLVPDDHMPGFWSASGPQLRFLTKFQVILVHSGAIYAYATSLCSTAVSPRWMLQHTSTARKETALLDTASAGKRPAGDGEIDEERLRAADGESAAAL
jgi:hypothetical protein